VWTGGLIRADHSALYRRAPRHGAARSTGTKQPPIAGADRPQRRYKRRLHPAPGRPGRASPAGLSRMRSRTFLVDLRNAADSALGRTGVNAAFCGGIGSKRQFVACCALSSNSSSDVLPRLRVRALVHHLAPREMLAALKLCQAGCTRPLPVPAPVATKTCPASFDAAPISVKSVSPT